MIVLSVAFLRRATSDVFAAAAVRRNIRQFISSQQNLPFHIHSRKYGEPAAGWLQCRPQSHEARRGEETYQRPCQLLRTGSSLISAGDDCAAGKALEVGTTVAVQAKVFGFWSLNAARIVYLIDERQIKTRGSDSLTELCRIMLSVVKRGLRSNGMRTTQFGMTFTPFRVPNILW